jgi:hypothetical protein
MRNVITENYLDVSNNQKLNAYLFLGGKFEDFLTNNGVSGNITFKRYEVFLKSVSLYTIFTGCFPNKIKLIYQNTGIL